MHASHLLACSVARDVLKQSMSIALAPDDSWLACALGFVNGKLGLQLKNWGLRFSKLKYNLHILVSYFLRKLGSQRLVAVNLWLIEFDLKKLHIQFRGQADPSPYAARDAEFPRFITAKMYFS